MSMRLTKARFPLPLKTGDNLRSGSLVSPLLSLVFVYIGVRNRAGVNQKGGNPTSKKAA